MWTAAIKYESIVTNQQKSLENYCVTNSFAWFFYSLSLSLLLRLLLHSFSGLSHTRIKIQSFEKTKGKVGSICSTMACWPRHLSSNPNRGKLITTGLKHANEKCKWYFNHVSPNNKLVLYNLSRSSDILSS